VKINAGAGVRAGAGVLCAVVLLAGGVVANGGGRSGPLGAGEEVTVDADGLAVALGADGQPIPAELGPAPELASSPVVDDPMARIDQERRAREAAPNDPKAQPAAAPLGAEGPVEPEADPDTLLVSFASGTSDADVAAALDRAGVQGERLAGSDTFEVATAGADHAELTEALEGQDAVAAVDANHVRTATRLPNDPSVGVQRSYLDGLGVPTAWDVTNQGAAVTVAVLDTGVDLDHPDLVGNLVPGYNAINPSATPQDDNGHGTLVAGIIGAGTNNANGVAGIAWNAKIMPVKVLGADGRGNDADLVEGIRWAVDHGADVINMSLGGPGGSSAIDYATLYAHGYDESFEHAYPQNDVVLTAAAGNDAAAMPNYPAAAFGVLGVTATDHAGSFAWFSNHGPWIDIAAPGIDVTSTALTAGPNSGTGAGTGTSFSSPIVAGVAALVREEHPGWPWYKVEYEMLRSATDRGPAGYDDTYGVGVVSASGALGLTGFGTVSQPNLAGDAANFPGSARAITVATNATESLAYEYDEDWFSFSVPQASSATVTVTPPIAADGFRAKEMDPMVEVYGPGGGQVATFDTTFIGEPETGQVNLAAGTHRIRVANYLGSASPSNYTVRVDLTPAGPPTDTFGWPKNLLPPSNDDRSVAAADINGDGRDDLIVSSPLDDRLSVLLQRADGTLAPPAFVSANPADPSQLATGDLDDDGDIDVVQTHFEGLDVAWNEGGALTDGIHYPMGQLHTVEVADLDGQGPDEVVVSGSDGLGVRVARWTGTEFSVSPIDVPQPGSSLLWNDMLAIGDVTGDGRPDVVGASDGGLTVSAQEADGSWAEPLAVPGGWAADNGPNSIAIGDVTGDARSDVVVAGGTGGAWLTHLPQQADGSLGAPVTVAAAATPGPVEIADVNADGRNDAVLLHNGRDGVGLFRQTAAATSATSP
jgi:subtilisin family serine protease